MKKRAALNITASILLQFVAMGCGLIIPRMILGMFGSEVNGLVSSLNQFLNYISLLEGGLGSVILAALYSPLALHDNKKLNAVLNAASHFFKQIAGIFLLYCLLLGVIYPFAVNTKFSWNYIFTLTLVLSINLFSQYYFAISYKLLLQADQKVYIVYGLQIGTYIANLLLTGIVLKLYPSIHIVKLISAAAYIIQPLGLHFYVGRHYKTDKNEKRDPNALSQRWSCFGQNIAYFIHANTDIVILSVFCGLKEVSVYSVYFMVVKSIRSLILSVSNAFTPIIGRYLAKGDSENLNRYLDMFEFCMFQVATVLFGCCLYMITPFVMIYTVGIHDANYYQPVFGVLLILSELIYCIRDPYVCVAYSAGKFKETAKGAYIEAAINIGLSLIMVKRFGLIGVAIGTCIGMLYRMAYHMIYLKKNIMNRTYGKAVKRIVIAGFILILGYILTAILDTTGSVTLMFWIKNGVISFVVNAGLVILISYLFDKDMMTYLIGCISMKFCRK